jgi:DNA-binding MarR family transcriptional regulator
MHEKNTFEFLRILREIMHRTDLRSRRLLRELGVSSTQAGVLRALSDGQTRSTGDLALELSLTGATLSGVLDRLEARGWIGRVRSPEDKRRMELRILPPGMDKLHETAARFQDPLTRGFDELPPAQQVKILDALQTVSELFDARDTYGLSIYSSTDEHG